MKITMLCWIHSAVIENNMIEHIKSLFIDKIKKEIRAYEVLSKPISMSAFANAMASPLRHSLNYTSAARNFMQTIPLDETGGPRESGIGTGRINLEFLVSSGTGARFDGQPNSNGDVFSPSIDMTNITLSDGSSAGIIMNHDRMIVSMNPSGITHGTMI